MGAEEKQRRDTLTKRRRRSQAQEMLERLGFLHVCVLVGVKGLAPAWRKHVFGGGQGQKSPLTLVWAVT